MNFFVHYTGHIRKTSFKSILAIKDPLLETLEAEEYILGLKFLEYSVFDLPRVFLDILDQFLDPWDEQKVHENITGVSSCDVVYF